MAGPGEKAIEHVTRKLLGFALLLKAFAGNKEGEMRDKAPWQDRTGAARAGLKAGVEAEGWQRMTVYFEHGVEYGEWLEEGTDPHEIRPRQKKALFWPGLEHPVKRAKHPGTKAYPILRPTAEEAGPAIRAMMERWFSE